MLKPFTFAKTSTILLQIIMELYTHSGHLFESLLYGLTSGTILGNPFFPDSILDPITLQLSTLNANLTNLFVPTISFLLFGFLAITQYKKRDGFFNQCHPWLFSLSSYYYPQQCTKPQYIIIFYITSYNSLPLTVDSNNVISTRSVILLFRMNTQVLRIMRVNGKALRAYLVDCSMCSSILRRCEKEYDGESCP